MAVKAVDDDGDSWRRHFVDFVGFGMLSEERRCWRELLEVNEYLYGWLQSRQMTEPSFIFRSFHPRSTMSF